MKKTLLVLSLLAFAPFTTAQNRVEREQTGANQVSQQIENQTKDVVKSRLPHRLSLYYSDLLWSGFQFPMIAANYPNLGNFVGMTRYASFGLNFDYQFISKSERWSYGIDVGYSYINTRYRNGYGDTYSANFLTIAPMVTCYYIKKGIVRLYGSVSVGVMMLIDKDQSRARLAFQLNPIGIRVGSNRVAGFFSLGIGSQGLCNFGVQVGI